MHRGDPGWGGAVTNLPPGKASCVTPLADARIAAFAARQYGVITAAQLAAAGLTPGAITKRVNRGVLHRRYRGVYAVGQPALSREGEWLAAVLACGAGSALSHLSAAELRGVSRFVAPAIAVVAPTPASACKASRCTRCRRLDPRELTTYRRIPVTTVHRMFVDLSDVLTPHQLANVIHEAAFRGLFVEAAVRDAMARADRPPPPRTSSSGRSRFTVRAARGRAAARRTRSCGSGSPSRSSTPPCTASRSTSTGPTCRVAVEVDGPGHGRVPDRCKDAGRDEVLAAAGYAVLRFTDADVHQRPDEVRRSTAAAWSCSPMRRSPPAEQRGRGSPARPARRPA